MLIIYEVKDMSECNSCPSNSSCSQEDKSQCMIENNPMNHVKNVIGVMSGKGGVGKSTVSALLAKQLKTKGYKVGILDSDITGPSIPRLLGVSQKKPAATEDCMHPVETEDGIKVMSLNLLMEDENQPVIWRGPIVSGAVKQFWTQVIWDQLDYLIIDMPPGTGDVALTVMQSIPITGLVMVSVPQDLVSMIVSKAVNMAKALNIEVLGVVENMSYIQCPDCNKKIKLFDADKTEAFLREMNLTLFGELPMISSISNLANNNGKLENVDELFGPITENVIKSLQK